MQIIKQECERFMEGETNGTEFWAALEAILEKEPNLIIGIAQHILLGFKVN